MRPSGSTASKRSIFAPASDPEKAPSIPAATGVASVPGSDARTDAVSAPFQSSARPSKRMRRFSNAAPPSSWAEVCGASEDSEDFSVGVFSVGVDRAA